MQAQLVVLIPQPMASIEKEKLKSLSDSLAEPSGLDTKKYGIWDFWTVQQARFDPRRRWEEGVSGLRLFRRLGNEIFGLAPGMLILFILSKIWTGIETAVLMHLSSQLLQIVRARVYHPCEKRFILYTMMD